MQLKVLHCMQSLLTSLLMSGCIFSASFLNALLISSADAVGATPSKS